MRLSRFAPEVAKRDGNARVGFAEALHFDVRHPENEDEAAIAQQRVAALHHVPLLLGTAHLLGAIAVVAHVGGRFSTLSLATIVIPILVALACDAAAYVLLLLRERVEIAAVQGDAGDLRAGRHRPGRCGACSARPPPTSPG